MLHVRPAEPADVPLLFELIGELAVYERLAHEVVGSAAELERWLFGEDRAAEALVGSVHGEPAGFALFFRTFSTFLTRPGLHLEDLFVRPAHRGLGLGAALLARLARLTEGRGYGRLEWAVLDWNEPAIGFYRQLGAEALEDWTTWRLTGPSLSALAERIDP